MFAGDSETTKQMDWRIPAAWLTLCIVWSSTWLAIKIGLRDLPPISFVAIRFLVAIVVLLAVSIGRTRLLPRGRNDYVVLAITGIRSEEHTSELQSLRHLVCRLLLEKKKYS